MLQEITGDIFTSDVEVIIHQANCFHKMRSGIAQVIRENFPEAVIADLTTKYGDESKLGTYSVATIRDGRALKYIVNMYSQHGYGKDEDGEPVRRTNYGAMQIALQAIKKDERFKGLKLGVPYKIGCGLARGDWNTVKDLLQTEFGNDSDYSMAIYRRAEDQ